MTVNQTPDWMLLCYVVWQGSWELSAKGPANSTYTAANKHDKKVAVRSTTPGSFSIHGTPTALKGYVFNASYIVNSTTQVVHPSALRDPWLPCCSWRSFKLGGEASTHVAGRAPLQDVP